MSRGFTLVELVIVIVVIGILAAVSVGPSVTDYLSTFGLTGAIRSLESEINQARDRAMATSRPQKLVFSLGSSTYEIYDAHPTQNVWQSASISYQFPTGISIQSTTLTHQALTYNAFGHGFEDAPADLPDSSQDLEISVAKTITLQNSRGDTKSVSILPATGYVRVD